MPEKSNHAREKALLFLSRRWIKSNDSFVKLNDTITFMEDEGIDPKNSRGGYSLKEGRKRVGNKFAVVARELRMAILDLIRKTRRRHLTRGKIDTPKLYRAGADVDLKVFYEPAQVMRISSAFSLLIDLSGSMSGEKLDIAGDLGFIFGNVLSQLNIPFEVAGFDGVGDNYDYAKRGSNKHKRCESLRYIVYKNFKNRWKNRQDYLNTLNASGSTPTHDAIAVACGRIRERREKKKVVMIVTDGQPALSNVPDYRVRRELQVTLALAKRQGIKVIGIGPDYAEVHNNFKDFVSVKDVNDLTGAVFGKLKDLLLSEAMKAKLGKR